MDCLANLSEVEIIILIRFDITFSITVLRTVCITQAWTRSWHTFESKFDALSLSKYCCPWDGDHDWYVFEDWSI